MCLEFDKFQEYNTIDCIMRKHRSGSFLPCIEYVLGLGQISGHMIDGLRIAMKKNLHLCTLVQSLVFQEKKHMRRDERNNE